MQTILKEGKGQVSKQAAILEAAFEIFSEKGFSATKLDEVALRAGVAKGTLYLYFDSKAELFKKVVETSIIINIEPLEKMLEGHQGPIFPVLEKVFEFVGEKLTQSRVGAFPRIIIAEATNFPDLAEYYRDNVILRIQGFFAHAIQKGIDQGEFRPVDPVASARILMAPFLMLALLSNIEAFKKGLKLDPGEHVEAARQILGHGLKVKE